MQGRILTGLALSLCTALASVGLVLPVAAKDPPCCVECGQPCCRKVCRVKCETKKTPKVIFSVECEDFCVPNKSDVCHTCEPDCCGCPKCKKHYVPTTADVYTKKKLIKRVEEIESKTYKWEVVHLCECCECNGACGAATDASTTEKPAADKPAGDKPTRAQPNDANPMDTSPMGDDPGADEVPPPPQEQQKAKPVSTRGARTLRFFRSTSPARR